MPIDTLSPAEADAYVQQLLDAYRIAELQILVALAERGGRLADWPAAFAKRQLGRIQDALGLLRRAHDAFFGQVIPAVYEHGLAVVDTRMMLPADLRGYVDLRRGGMHHIEAVGRVNAVRPPPTTPEYQALIAKGQQAEKVVADLRQEHPGSVFGTNRLAAHQEVAAERAIAPPVTVEEAKAQAEEARAAPEPAVPRIVTPTDADFRQIHQPVLNNLSVARSHPLNSEVYRVEETFSWKKFHREENLRVVQDGLAQGQDVAKIRKRLLEQYADRKLTAGEAAEFRRALQNRKVAPTQQELDALKEGKLWVYVDKAGRQWTPRAYADMIARTTIREAEELAIDQEQIALGEDLIEVSDHRRECWQCRPWEGVILSITGATNGFLTKAEARARGLWHPRCGHKSLPRIAGLSIDVAAIEAANRDETEAKILLLTRQAKQQYLEGELA